MISPSSLNETSAPVFMGHPADSHMMTPVRSIYYHHRILISAGSYKLAIRPFSLVDQ